MKFLKSVIDEMKKVSWPLKAELRKDTLVVLETTIIFALLFWAFDSLIRLGINAIM